MKFLLHYRDRHGNTYAKAFASVAAAEKFVKDTGAQLLAVLPSANKG